MTGRRVIVVVFILAGVFLPLWLFGSKNLVRPLDDLLPSPPTEAKSTQQDEQALPRNTVPARVMAVRLPPPPSPSHLAPVSSTVPKEPVRITPLKAVENKVSIPRAVAALKPAQAERKKRTEPKLATLKPDLREVATIERKSVRALRPSPTRTEAPPGTKLVNVPMTVQKIADQTVEVRVRSSAPEVRKGRKLLKLLEHGKGPTIEITWPRNEAERARLFGYLSACYGMQTALLDGNGQLYVEGGRRGRRWEINLDRFSGFVRRPDGIIAPAERRAAEKVRRYHGLIPAAHVVRIFPRVVDAALLGGLKRLMGDAYAGARTIRGHYRITQGGLVVEAINYDNRNVLGAISFPPVGGSSCG